MPRRKALKVIADVHLHATTCPGVFLPEQQDVFLYVELFGQRKRTQSTPPVFPFLFHEKLRFDKVFSHCTDPVQIASALDGETLRVELVQLTYPGGELLATYEDNARDFLFPTPRVCPSYPGVDREVLLQRASSFPGIAPKLEFSSRTVIKEVTSVSSGSHSARRKKEKHKIDNDVDSYKSPCCASYKSVESAPPVKSSTPYTSKSHRSSSKKKTKPLSSSSPRSGRARTRATSLNRGSTKWGYERPTIASMSRSPSPYTRRRMAQLSIKDPFDSAVKEKPFKTDSEERPSFVVRKAPSDGLSFNKSPPDLPRVSPSPNRRAKSSSPHNRANSPSRRKQTPGPPSRYRSRARGYDSDDTTELIESSAAYQRRSSPGGGKASPRGTAESTPRPVTPRRDLSFSRADLDHEPVASRADRSGTASTLYRKPLCERFGVGGSSPYEKIRDRVRNLLSSPRATQIIEDSMEEANDRYRRRRSRSPSPRSTPRY